jgi:hypothetical protein
MGDVTDSEIAMDGPAASFGMLAAIAAKQNVGERVCVKEPFAFKVIVPRLHVRVDARGIELASTESKRRSASSMTSKVPETT